MKAIGNFIVASVVEATQSAGGVLLPVDQSERVQKAEVISVGETVESPIKEGDVILYDRNNAVQFTENAKKFVGINVEKVIAVQ